MTAAHISEKYQAEGYSVVDDFLPLEVADFLNKLYVREKNWEQVNQVRDAHYRHVFKTAADCLPGADESYIAKFGRSRSLETSPEFLEIYEGVIKPLIDDVLDIRLSSFDVRCYRLLPGDLYRTHIDDYAGDIGFIYYLNKRWVWDWGGLLHLCSDNEKAAGPIECILPKFNRAILINHKTFRFPHFINSVEPFALEPRYALISFNR